MTDTELREFETKFSEGFSNAFYQLPSMLGADTELQRQQRRSPAIDVAQACAIFLFLVTGVVPKVPGAHRCNNVIKRRLVDKCNKDKKLVLAMNGFFDVGLHRDIAESFRDVAHIRRELATLHLQFKEAKDEDTELVEEFWKVEVSGPLDVDTTAVSVVKKCQHGIRILKKALSKKFGLACADDSARCTEKLENHKDICCTSALSRTRRIGLFSVYWGQNRRRM